MIFMNLISDSLFLYHWSQHWRNKLWKRQCRLQIAYSFVSDSSKIVTKSCSAQKNTCSTRVSNPSANFCHNTDKIQKSKLPSLEEAIQVSNTLIKDVNYFGGYLRPVNFYEDRENFLKSFEAERKKIKDISNIHSCARYMNNKLNFDFPSKRPFNVMYEIHKIVYTNGNKNTSNTQEIAHAK